MNKKTKTFLYNFICFALLYTLMYFIVVTFTQLTGLWIPVTAAIVSSILAPKFQVVNFQNEEKIFMRWMFIKGVKEIK